MTYVLQQWKDEMCHPNQCSKCEAVAMFFTSVRLNPLGTCLPCPKCNVVGFYAARHNPSNDQKYRMCKFCGLWQEVGKEEKHCNMFYHDDCPELQGCAPFEHKMFGCEFAFGTSPDHQVCRQVMIHIIDPPTIDNNHPYNELKEEIRKKTK